MKGKVLRISPQLHEFLSSSIRERETYDHALKRLLRVRETGRGKLTQDEKWTLPSLTFGTRKEALGYAIKEAVKERRSLEEREEPLKVLDGEEREFKQKPRKKRK